MPYGFGQLTSLQTLTKFVLVKKNASSSRHRYGSGISELSSLNSLRGSLEIKGLENLRNNAATEVNAANLVKKPFLKSLTLRWEDDDSDENMDNFSKDELILEVLQPHSKIRSLLVYGSGGARFCDWLSSISNLLKLYISGCPELQYLPQLHQLPHLENLTLKWMPSLEYIDCDGSEEECSFSSTTSSSALFFPSLRSLRLQGNCNLQGWWRSSSEVAVKATEHHLASFSRLSELYVDECPNLISMPLNPHVEKLTCIKVGKKMLHQFLKPPTSTTATGRRSQATSSSLSHHSSVSKLRYLNIENIRDLESLPRKLFSNLTSLQNLSIRKCHKLKYVSPILQHLSALQELRVSNCDQLDLYNDGNYGMHGRNLAPSVPCSSGGFLSWCIFQRVFNMLPP
ncbi:NBS-LRR disease resistance protein [Quillaja saponaria]|uniref:NBS-LRR disease resistance protein n=1 Tax=Quillaja saponaria TaxID=32244 RepID=A0AAD7L075_QUISA|nr:NBS-LRR disease resistance protein [Quillaja saponaria]